MEKSRWLYFDKSKELFHLSRFDESRFYIEKAEKCKPDDVRVLELFGRICLAQHDYSAAEYYFSRCFNVVSDYSEIFYYYALALNGLRKYEKAITLLVKCIEIVPFSNKMIVALTETYVLNDESEKAIELLSSSLNECSHNAQLWYHLACLYKDNDMPNDALLAVLQSIKEEPNAKKALLLLSKLFLLRFGFDINGLQDMDFALLNEPTIRQKLCKLLTKSGSEKELAFFSKDIPPNEFDQNTLFFIIRALLYENENYISKEYMSEYLNSAPYAPKALYKLGNELLENDKNESALICFGTCYKVESDNSFAMRGICECLLRLGRNEKLVCLAKKHMDAYGFNSCLSYMIAKAFVKLENNGMALYHIFRCVDEEPFNHVFLSYTGYIYLIEGDLKSAEYYTSLSLKFHPEENEKAQKNIARIKYLKSIYGTYSEDKRQIHIKKHFYNNTFKYIHGVFTIPEKTILQVIDGLKTEVGNSGRSIMKFRIPYVYAGYAGGRLGDGHVYDHITVISLLRKECVLTAYPSD